MDTKSLRRSRAALHKALQAAGSQSELARMIGTRQSTVSSWFRRGSLPDPEACLDIEQATGVAAEELRPDLFGRFLILRAARESTRAAA